jgi:tagatose-1,6-bisphosphate aldolase non-catalytic subunit AgaZ/GatZ
VGLCGPQPSTPGRLEPEGQHFYRIHDVRPGLTRALRGALFAKARREMHLAGKTEARESAIVYQIVSDRS